MRRVDLLAVIFCLAAGTAFRLVWPADMEWKGDEKLMYADAIEAAHSGVLPQLGMGSGVNIPNPGASIWSFAFFARWTENPVAMVQWVQWTNIVALWGFFFLFMRVVPVEQRHIWLWGLALFAVSPLPVLFARKLWAQDLLPLLGAVTLAGHFQRRTRIGAFVWGLAGALIGQVHMSGFFFAFALAAATFVHDWRTGRMRETRWLTWLVASALGAALLIPWLMSVLGPHVGHVRHSVREIGKLGFYVQWLLTAWGLGPVVTRYGGVRFLPEPLIWGHASYLMVVACAYLLGVGLWVTVRWVLRGFRPRFEEPLAFYLTVMGLVVGVLMTISGFRARVHYLIVVAPFVHLWVAGITWPRRRILMGVIGAQMAVTTALLLMIHREGGMPWAEYGVSYRAQQRAAHPDPRAPAPLRPPRSPPNQR